MFKRVMVAVVGIPFLLLVLIWAPEWCTLVLLAGMCAIGAWELMHAVRGERGASLANPMVWAPVLMALLVPVRLWGIHSRGDLLLFYLENPSEEMLENLPAVSQVGMDAMVRQFAELGLYVLVFLLVLFVCAILAYGKEKAVPFGDLTAAVFAGLVFPLMLSCLLLLRLEEYGQALVFVPLCISFGSDTFALFAGMLFGKHKLTPVSPKKTVEGAVGGLLGGVIGMLLFKLISQAALDTVLVGWTGVLVFGLLGSVAGQIGDLSFSVIKREFGVKDYGHLLPGHGGILDRFDSVTFVAPLVWLAMTLFRL